MRQYTYHPEIDADQLPALEHAIEVYNQSQANIIIDGVPAPPLTFWTERVIGREGKLTAHVNATGETQILQVGILAGKYMEQSNQTLNQQQRVAEKEELSSEAIH